MWIRAFVLPERYGRIRASQDKTNGCHLIYNQPGFKPAHTAQAKPSHLLAANLAG